MSVRISIAQKYIMFWALYLLAILGYVHAKGEIDTVLCSFQFLNNISIQELDICQVLPTVYEYFETGNERQVVGLVADPDGFK